MEEIFQKGIELKNKMLELFPDSCSTICINIWEDGDYLVQCRYGLENLIHVFRYTKFTDEIKYIKETFFFEDIYVMDELGEGHYFSPKQLNS